MKSYITGLLAELLSACSVNADTTLSFGADFKLTLPQTLMAGATVFWVRERGEQTLTPAP